ncbi:MAG: apolipoprotein N-acyltransferase [Rhodothermales bacterium]
MKSKNIHINSGSRWVAILASGLGLAFSFPPYPFPFVSCLALIPILRRWHNGTDAREIYLDFFYAFLILFTITFSWPLQHPFSQTAIASLSGVLLLPMSLALPFAMGLKVKIKRGPRWGLLTCVVFFLSIEWFWAHGPIAMPGALLGHALANQLYFIQFIDITGVAGLSLWILAINMLLLLMLESKQPLRQYRLISLVALLFLAAPAYSVWKLKTAPDIATKTTRVAAIQPAISSLEWSSEQDKSRVSFLMALTDSLLLSLDSSNAAQPDVVLWPETALPVLEGHQDSLLIELTAWQKSKSFELITGAILRTPTSDPLTSYSNSVLLIPRQGPIQQYNKNWLVPFAEHVPFESWLRPLSNLRVDAGGIAGYQPGTQQPLLELAQAQTSIGVLVCFESLFGDYSRRYADNGASFLVALSNIGWWGSRIAPGQYLAFSKLRAIESRRSLILNTVTGPAMVVDPMGRTQASYEWMERGLILTDIPHMNSRSFYVRYGDCLGLLSLVISIFILIQFTYASQQTRQNKPV